MKRDNLTDFLDRLGHLKHSSDLIRLINPSPYMVCFIPAVDRLADLFERYPNAFANVQVPTPSELRSWTSSARQAIAHWSSPDRALGAHLNKSGIAASKRQDGTTQHPLKNFGLWEYGCHAALIITKPTEQLNTVLGEGFDHLSAWVIGYGLRYNIRFTGQSSPLSSSSSERSVYFDRLVKASVALTRLQAMEGPTWLFKQLSDTKLNPDLIVEIFEGLIDRIYDKKSTGEDPKEHIKTAEQMRGFTRLFSEKPPPKKVASDPLEADA